MCAYLSRATLHDLVGDLLHIVLNHLRLVLVLESKGLIFDKFGLLFLNSLGRRSLLILLGRHGQSVVFFLSVNQRLQIII